MIPTTLTNTPPPAPLPTNVGIFNQIGSSCNNSALPSYTPALLGIASLILEGRDFIDDDYIPQRIPDVQNGDWAALNKFNRLAPESSSTHRAAYSDHTNGIGGYMSCNQKLDSNLYIDTAACSSSSSSNAASLFNSHKTRWSQKLSQLRQESPLGQVQEQIVEMETTSANRNSEALDIAPMSSSSIQRSNDNEMVRRVTLNRIKTYNTLMTAPRESNMASFNEGSDDRYNVCAFSTNISGFVQENFMSSLQLLATNTCLRVGTPIYNTTCTNRPSPYLMSDVSIPSVSGNESTINLMQTPKSSSYWLQNLAIPPLSMGQRTSCMTLSTSRRGIPFQHTTNDDDGGLQKFTKMLDTSVVDMRPHCSVDKARKQCTNNRTPQEGPHCNQFLRKMGLIKTTTNCDVEEHCCDMSHINVTCTRWRAHSLKIEDILSRGETICIEVYLGPVDHKILLEQWIITIKDKQPPPTMTLSSLCSAIRSQLYFSQVSAWCDLLKKADKKIYETGRLIFTTPLNSAAGDLVISTPTTIASPTSSANITTTGTGTVMSSATMLQLNQRKPKLNIFFGIKQFDGTASFKSKPNVHNFPNVNLTESSCVSVCLKSLPRFSGGVPPIIDFNGQSVVPITSPSVVAVCKTDVTMPKKSKASVTSSIALNQSINVNCDILQKNQFQQQKQKSAKHQKSDQTLIDNIPPFNSAMKSPKQPNASDVASVRVDESSDNNARPITFIGESPLNEANSIGDNDKSLLSLCNHNGNSSNVLSNSSNDVVGVRDIDSTTDYYGESLLSPPLFNRSAIRNCSNSNSDNNSDHIVGVRCTESAIDHHRTKTKLVVNENLKHRERQLMKYRKRMFKRDKQQEQHPHSQHFKINDTIASPPQLSPIMFRGPQQNYKSISSTSSVATVKVDETSPSQRLDQIGDEDYAIEGESENEDDNLAGGITQDQHASVTELIWKGMAVGETINQREQQLRISNNMNITASINPSNPSDSSKKYDKEISNGMVRTMASPKTSVTAAAASHNEIQMISTGTQTPANYCHACGTLKTLICMQCTKYMITSDSELSSPVKIGSYKKVHDNKNNHNDDSERIYTDNDNSYSNIVSKGIELEVNSSQAASERAVTSSASSSNSLHTNEIIYTPSTNVQLLLQGVQYTSKAVATAAMTEASESQRASSLPSTSVKKYRNSKVSSKECHQSNITSTRNKNKSDISNHNNSNNNHNNNYMKIKNNHNNSTNSRHHNKLEEVHIMHNNDDEDIIITNASVIAKAITTTTTVGTTMATTSATATAMAATIKDNKKNIPIKSNTLLVIGCQVCKRQKTQHNFLSPEQEPEKQQQIRPLENIMKNTRYHVIPTVTTRTGTEIATARATATKTLYTALYDNKNRKTAISEDDDDDDNNNKKHNEINENAIITTQFNATDNVVEVEKFDQYQRINNNQSDILNPLINSKIMDDEDKWSDNTITTDEECLESSTKFTPNNKQCSKVTTEATATTTTTNTTTTMKRVGGIACTKNLFCSYLHQQQEEEQTPAEISPSPFLLLPPMRSEISNDQNHNVGNKDEQYIYDDDKQNIMAQFKTPTKESTITTTTAAAITTNTDFEIKRRQQLKQKQPPRHKGSLSKLWKIGCNFHYYNNADIKCATDNTMSGNSVKDNKGIGYRTEKLQNQTTSIKAKDFKSHLITSIQINNNIVNDDDDDNNNNNNDNENNNNDNEYYKNSNNANNNSYNNENNNNNESNNNNNVVDDHDHSNNNNNDDDDNNNNNTTNDTKDTKNTKDTDRYSCSNSRRNLLKVNLTPIFCNSSAMMPSSLAKSNSSTTLLSASYFMDDNEDFGMASILMSDKIHYETTKTTIANMHEKRRKEEKCLSNLKMPPYTCDLSNSPTSPASPSTIQKTNSASVLSNSSRFYNVYTICKRRSRLSDRSSIASDDQYSDDDIDCLNSTATSTTIVSSNKSLRNHHRYTNMLFARKPLLGNLEESLLQRRLLPKLEVTGFRLLLGASGNFCPVQLTLPADAYFYELYGDTLSTPYLCEARLPRKGYTIPRFGTVQATLLNPMGTVVRMFVIPYDMSDMPSLHQTFVRQRILADNSRNNDDRNGHGDNMIAINGDNSTTNQLPIKTVMSTADITTTAIMQDYNNCDNNTNGDCFNNVVNNMTIHIRQQQQKQQQQQQQQHRSPINCRNESNLRHFIPPKDMKSLRYSIHLRFQTSRSGRLMLHTDIRLLISKRTDCDTAAAHAKGILETTNNDLIIDTVMPTNPKYSVRQQQQQQQQQHQQQQPPQNYQQQESTIMNKI